MLEIKIFDCDDPNDRRLKRLHEQAELMADALEAVHDFVRYFFKHSHSGAEETIREAIAKVKEGNNQDYDFDDNASTMERVAFVAMDKMAEQLTTMLDEYDYRLE